MRGTNLKKHPFAAYDGVGTSQPFPFVALLFRGMTCPAITEFKPDGPGETFLWGIGSYYPGQMEMMIIMQKDMDLHLTKEVW